MPETPLPSRQAALYPHEDDIDDYTRWIDEVALPIVAEWASGRLVDRVAIDYDELAQWFWSHTRSIPLPDWRQVDDEIRDFWVNEARLAFAAALGEDVMAKDRLQEGKD